MVREIQYLYSGIRTNYFRYENYYCSLRLTYLKLYATFNCSFYYCSLRLTYLQLYATFKGAGGLHQDILEIDFLVVSDREE